MGNHEIRGVPARLGLRLAMILYNINWQIDIKTCAAELNLTHCADATDCYATNCQAAGTGGKVASGQGRQSIAPRPFASRNALAWLNGWLPKNPRCADSGLGWTLHSTRWRGADSAASRAAFFCA